MLRAVLQAQAHGNAGRAAAKLLLLGATGEFQNFQVYLGNAPFGLRFVGRQFTQLTAHACHLSLQGQHCASLRQPPL